MGIDENIIDKMQFYDKGYGWYRDLMDEYGTDQCVNIQKFMIDNGHRSLNSMPHDDLSEDIQDLGHEYNLEESLIEDILEGKFEGFWLNTELQHQLDKFKGATVIGGGKTECLAEVKCLMDAYDMKYTINNRFVYG